MEYAVLLVKGVIIISAVLAMLYLIVSFTKFTSNKQRGMLKKETKYDDETTIPIETDIRVIYKERPDLIYRIIKLRLTFNGINDPTMVCVVTARCITEGSYFNSSISATSNNFDYLYGEYE